MLSYAELVQREFLKLAAERAADLQTSICNGQMDYAAYRFHAGVLNGLNQIPELIEEATKNVNGKEER